MVHLGRGSVGLHFSTSVSLVPTCCRLLLNYLPEIIMHTLSSGKCLDFPSPDNSPRMAIIPLMIPLMLHSPDIFLSVKLQ